MTVRSATTANIDTVWAAMVAGDTMQLATGSYGDWTPALKSFASDAIIEPATSATVTFRTITFANGETHVHLRSANSGTITVDLNPSSGTSASTQIIYCNACMNITIGGTSSEGITIKSADPATGGLGNDMRGYGIYIEGSGSANISIQHNTIQNTNLSIAFFQTTDGAIENNTLDGVAADFMRFDAAAGSAAGSKLSIANNVGYNDNYNQAAPLKHPDFIQFTDILGGSSHVHITGNVFIQTAQAGVEGDSGDASDAQFIFLTNDSASVAYDDFLIEQNICITSPQNGIYCENFTNSTIQNNTVLWYPDTRVAALPGVEMLQGSAADLQSSNTIQNNIGFRFTTDNAVANTFTGNTTIQWEFPHSSGGDFAPDLFLNILQGYNIRPTAPDSAGLVRHPDAGFGTKGASTREADFAPTLFIDAGAQRGTVNSLTYNFDCRVYATNTTASGATGFNWDFGDGNTLSGTDATQSHTFDNARDGPYTVTCTRISDNAVGTITVKPTSPYYLHFQFDNDDFTNSAEGGVDMRETLSAAWVNAGSFIDYGSGRGIHVGSTQYAQANNSTNAVACEQALYDLASLTITFDITLADSTLVNGTAPVDITSYATYVLLSRTTSRFTLVTDAGGEFPSFTHPGNIDDGSTHHMVFQFDGASNQVNLWDNGTALGPVAITGSKLAADTSERSFLMGQAGAGLVMDMDNPLVVIGLMTPTNEDTLVAGWQSGLAVGGGGSAGSSVPFHRRGRRRRRR